MVNYEPKVNHQVDSSNTQAVVQERHQPTTVFANTHNLHSLLLNAGADQLRYLESIDIAQ
jgi:hypothetical protein